ncbi:MAG: hypothetical protein H6Q72_2854 [Firmicutes bacterium]|nr:hypothetical protein [Bacillota bacterium]
MELLKEFFKCYVDSDTYNLTFINEKFQCDQVLARKKCIIFGASEGGKKFLELLKKLNIEIIAIIDNDKQKWGTVLDGIHVLSPNSVQQYRDIPIIITSRYVAAIDRQLKLLGVKQPIPHYVLSVVYPQYFPNSFHKYMKDIFCKERKKIEKAYSLLSDMDSRQLFLQILKFRVLLDPFELPDKNSLGYSPVFSLSQEADVIVDIGAYDGDTLREFIKHSQGKFCSYIAFEPDEYNYNKLLANIPSNYKERIVVYKLGVGSKHEFVSFSCEGNMSSAISKNGNDKIELIALDEFINEKRISLIKMDVEGFENEVLLGAKGIIKRDNPKLLVSAYHYPEDLWNLQLLVQSINSSYKFYLRHLDEEIYETMLFVL